MPMPPRLSPAPPKGAFYPVNDAATYRDLLLFEERLKTNAASLNRRKHRYQLFLAQLLLLIAFLLTEVVLHANLLGVPCTFVLRRLLPRTYAGTADVKVHPYVASGLLFVAVTTLVLFFASGLYAEKIGYANRYVPHANRALRNFNMYLNVRQPPLRAKLPFNPLPFLFPRSPPPTPAPKRTPSPPAAARRRSPSAPIPSIPPASSPRGELIFSSRVDRAFREAYERYRAAFERRRERREAAAAADTWAGWLRLRVRGATPTPTPGTATPVSGVSRAGSARERVSEAGASPAGSRRSSPVPGRTRRGAVRGGTPPAGQHPLASEMRGR